MLYYLKSSRTFRFFALICILPTLAFSTSFIVQGGKDELKLGKKAPMRSEKMAGVDGISRSLGDLNMSNGLIVVFSCNSCPFVVGSDKFEGWEVQYNAIAQKAKENNIGFVLINSNEAKRDGADSMEKMKLRAEEKGYTMPYLIDIDSKLANAFGAKTTPHIFMLDNDAKLIYRGSIDNSWDSKRSELIPYLYNAIENVKTNTAIKENDTAPRGCSIKRTK